MRKIETLGLLATILLYTGCSTHQADAKIDFKPPKYVEQVPPREKFRGTYNPGSLFGRGDNPVFSDKKAMNVNDIVTVVIDENILSSSSGSKKIKKTTNDKLGGAVFAGGPGNFASQANKITDISAGISSNNSFNATGTNERKEKFTTTISARIIKILENGNYFIDGRREMLINGQKQILHVNGVIRPEDITQTNMIDSKHIADAKILYETQGDIKEATEKGWGTKAIESVWPF
ncbi:flagellar basal body L-ring protein FlgH [Hydrogenimonas urashimensis]|uniref:flagellar basal body L-ring protein FlgH n=1 Tax=Hydrogenimonas urashimensis TaxID=2740515 RepID=UPI001915163E|nr:flagellar basal body L-ring protein FlgH [Hydrogenimonas urashimensis]